MSGIYVHVPFCKQACSYCDFHFSTNLTYTQRMVDAICAEANLQKQFLKSALIETIYFGGGTPSTLNLGQIEQILRQFNRSFNTAEVIELTFECNPDDLDFTFLNGLKHLGINRVSLGVQSFNNEHLKLMNRAHDSKMIEKSIEAIKAAGFENFTIDLIYGLPGLSEREWQVSLQKLIDWNVPHFSAYALGIEDKTLLKHQVEKGIVVPETDEVYYQQFKLLQEFCVNAGFDTYEISNYSLPNRRALHNSNYWKGKPYLGLGPSAHSFDGKKRQWNISNNTKYLSGIEQEQLVFETETLSDNDLFNEYLMTHLRMAEGICKTEILENFGQQKINYLTELIPKIDSAKDLFYTTNRGWTLTTKGKFISDYLTRELIIVAE